jgi:hypothetical protein
MELADELDPAQLKKRPGRTRMFDVQQILDCLTDEGLTATEWKTAAKFNYNVSPSTFYELRAKVVADGQAEERDKKWFRIHKVVFFRPMADPENRKAGDAV